MPGPSSSKYTRKIQTTPKEYKSKQTKQAYTRPKAKVETKWSKNKLVKLATQNQRRQQAPKSRSIKIQSGTTKKNRQSTPKSSFNYIAQQAALLESANISKVKPGPGPNRSQADSETSNRSFLIFNVDDPKPNSIQTHYIDTEQPGEEQHVIHTSNNPSDFMVTIPESPPVTIKSPPSPSGEPNIFGTIQDNFSRSKKRIDKVVRKIHSCQSSPTSMTQPKQSPIETTALINIRAPEVINLDSSNSSQDPTNIACEQQSTTHANNNTTDQHGTTQNQNVPLHMEPAKSLPNSSV